MWTPMPSPAKNGDMEIVAMSNTAGWSRLQNSTRPYSARLCSKMEI
jgi:hypothetical protein